ncbi:MAG: hypothetical protein KC766_14970 [Myxococcales bacterium]|nr:hypothetical protein [Myxococcales bacterium]
MVWFRVCAGVLLAGLATMAGCSASDGNGPGGGGSGQGGSAGSGNGGSAQGGSGNNGGSTQGGNGGSTTGGGDIGDPCTTNADCTIVEGSECWTTIGGGGFPEVTFPGGYCGKACSNEGGNECGENAGCTMTSVSGGMGSVTLSMCTPPCSGDEECRASEGYHCQIVFGNFGVCVP